MLGSPRALTSSQGSPTLTRCPTETGFSLDPWSRWVDVCDSGSVGVG
jgi:hypothetical protein